MKKVWDYLKEKKLQDPKDKQWFTPDQTMAPVFGNEKMRGFCMLRQVKKHLTYAGCSSASQSSLSGGVSSSSSSSLDLECPICRRPVKPPMRLQQCGQVGTNCKSMIIPHNHWTFVQGHITCDDCHHHMISLNPKTGNQCHSCRGPITGRPNTLEKMLGLIWATSLF